MTPGLGGDVPVSPIQLALLVVAAFGAGVVDSIAGGGGLIALPALLAVGLPPQLAIPTNKGQSVFGTLSSSASYWRRGGVDRSRALPAFCGGFAGACVGATALGAMPPGPLRPVIIGLLVLAATVVLLRSRFKPRARPVAHPTAAVLGIALGMGTYDGFFGPGVGSLIIVAFVLTFGDTLTRASGNAKMVNVGSNIAAVAIFAAKGLVLWRISLPMAAANATGAMLGVRFALAKGDRVVRVVILVVVVAVIVKLAVDMTRG